MHLCLYLIINLLVIRTGLTDHVRGGRIHFYNQGVGGENKVDQLIAYNIKHPSMVIKTFPTFREEFNDTHVCTNEYDI